MPPGKTLQEQMDEIKHLVSTASETLRQVDRAMETLAARLPEAPAQAPRAAPAAPAPAGGNADPVPTGDAHADDVPERRRRHLRWVRGTQTPPPAH